eukprot:jgi/Orpsp1_1/1174833/evm.model.c7180000051602.1
MNIDEQRKNIIKIIINENLEELISFIKINNINLKKINSKEFDILIFVIDKYISFDIVNYIIQKAQYETLNYSFNIKNGYLKYNNDFFIHSDFLGFKIPLYTAIINKNFEIADLLIKYKADINYGLFNKNFGTIDIMNYFFYINAISYNIGLDIENLRYILNSGFYIKAIKEKNFDAIKIFLDYDGIEQNIIENRIIKYNILEKAVEYNNFKLVEKIINSRKYKIPINIIENIIITECKISNITKVELFIKMLDVKILSNINFEKILLE